MYPSPHVPLPLQGPYFAPPYERLPPEVKFYYNGTAMELSEKAEEAAGFFAKMLDHEYTSKDIFCKNFFEDWRKVRWTFFMDTCQRGIRKHLFKSLRSSCYKTQQFIKAGFRMLARTGVPHTLAICYCILHFGY